MREYKQAVSGVVRDGADYLLLQKERGRMDFWELPGGSLEDDETPLEGIAREFEEELGYDVAECVSELKGFRPYSIETRGNAYKVYPHDIELSERISPELSDEHVNCGWFSRRDVEEMVRGGDFNRPYTETLSYVELTEPERYEFIGRPSWETALEVGEGESLEEAVR